MHWVFSLALPFYWSLRQSVKGVTQDWREKKKRRRRKRKRGGLERGKRRGRRADRKGRKNTDSRKRRRDKSTGEDTVRKKLEELGCRERGGTRGDRRKYS
ncbi:hypothetical protein GOODEAATRI_016518 [Goodea atripinnis]|uniref:Uncharacterized protein n=1 Tax=Goodea atripinnis TaxID=208336 RepID=A0ABV0P4T2_9TELE